MLALVLTLAVAQTPVPMPGPQAQARFQASFAAAEKLFTQGEYGAAIHHFRQAELQRVTPEVAYDLAKCFEKLGDLPMAAYYYRRYLERAPNAEDADAVRVELARALGYAHLRGLTYVEIDAPAHAQLQVDTRLFPRPPAATFLAPGAHDVVLLDGLSALKERFSAKYGSPLRLWLEPAPPPLFSAAVVPRAAVEPPPPPPKKVAPLTVLGLVVAGVGAGLLAGAITFGVLSEADAAAARDRRLTVSDAFSLWASSNERALLANVGFLGGGSLSAGGFALLVVSALTRSKP